MARCKATTQWFVPTGRHQSKTAEPDMEVKAVIRCTLEVHGLEIPCTATVADSKPAATVTWRRAHE